jgi:hypothetical protein
MYNMISKEAFEFYNSKKDDENASLILEKYSFPINKIN